MFPTSTEEIIYFYILYNYLYIEREREKEDMIGIT